MSNPLVASWNSPKAQFSKVRYESDSSSSSRGVDRGGGLRRPLVSCRRHRWRERAARSAHTHSADDRHHGVGIHVLVHTRQLAASGGAVEAERHVHHQPRRLGVQLHVRSGTAQRHGAGHRPEQQRSHHVDHQPRGHHVHHGHRSLRHTHQFVHPVLHEHLVGRCSHRARHVLHSYPRRWGQHPKRHTVDDRAPRIVRPLLRR